MNDKLIPYYRVSTQKQGQSGLGLEAQQHAVESYARSINGVVIASYREVETGKGANPERPQLREALPHARRSGATLVIAKLDRLSRNVAFLSNLMEAGVDFVCCDNPHANRLTLHILAAIAEYEAKMISERTKEALAAAKRRGKVFGAARPGHFDGMCNCRACNNEPDKREQCQTCGGTGKRDISRREAMMAGVLSAGKRSRAVRQEKSIKFIREASDRILSMRAAGMTFQGIADKLNQEQFLTPRGRLWHHVYVHRFVHRAKAMQLLDSQKPDRARPGRARG